MSQKHAKSKDLVGRCVMVEFPFDAESGTKKRRQAFFRGKVQQASMMMRADKDQSIQQIQLVVFEDGEEYWMNLKEQQALGRVVWPQEEETEDGHSKPAASAAVSRKRTAPPSAATVSQEPKKPYPKKRIATMTAKPYGWSTSQRRRPNDDDSEDSNNGSP